ncbi:hypothetical protein [Deinococcus arcticus]|uniref:hypothetical protein n=1 Tax=Deinococcus arcticus TaxID=2136176 RepID=UPI001304D13F|nr:hypothetical protein [Deinococcus arcticus]
MKPLENEQPLVPLLMPYEPPMVRELGPWTVVTLAQSVAITGTGLFDPGQQEW